MHKKIKETKKTHKDLVKKFLKKGWCVKSFIKYYISVHRCISCIIDIKIKLRIKV